jgi:hypothetical protein
MASSTVQKYFEEMKKRYPRTLSSGANNVVIALSESEVGKLYTGDTRSDIGSEAEKIINEKCPRKM